jgi:hypothetical protein
MPWSDSLSSLSDNLIAKLCEIRTLGNISLLRKQRQAAQCVGRVIRSKADYGMMLFADKRFV